MHVVVVVVVATVDPGVVDSVDKTVADRDDGATASQPSRPARAREAGDVSVMGRRRKKAGRGMALIFDRGMARGPVDGGRLDLVRPPIFHVSNSLATKPCHKGAAASGGPPSPPCIQAWGEFAFDDAGRRARKTRRCNATMDTLGLRINSAENKVSIFS
jgi:hypothetical protein